jgi:hypothetical protein
MRRDQEEYKRRDSQGNRPLLPLVLLPPMACPNQVVPTASATIERFTETRTKVAMLVSPSEPSTVSMGRGLAASVCISLRMAVTCVEYLSSEDAYNGITHEPRAISLLRVAPDDGQNHFFGGPGPGTVTKAGRDEMQTQTRPAVPN